MNVSPPREDPSLDFANTLTWRLSQTPRERLGSYADVVRWALEAGLVSQAEARELDRRAARQPAQAERILDRARRLREAIFGLFAASVRGRTAGSADLGVLNDELVSASAHQKLVHRGGGYALEWDGVEALDGLLWPVARSAATLLTSDLRSRVRICAAEDGCGWTFLDRSKNQSRRWCSMSDCGNRAKARRHYRRVRRLAPRS